MHIFLCDTNAFKHSQQYWSPLSAADCAFMIIKTCHCGFSYSMYLKDIACFVINLLTLYCRQFISFIFWQIYTRCRLTFQSKTFFLCAGLKRYLIQNWTGNTSCFYPHEIFLYNLHTSDLRFYSNTVGDTDETAYAAELCFINVFFVIFIPTSLLAPYASGLVRLH